MKIKTSITLTNTLVADMDQVCGGAGRRSAFVEDAIRARLDKMKRRRRDDRDLAILNKYAEDLRRPEFSDIPIL